MNQLLHGDCMTLMADLPEGSVDMVFCDLPYGMTANDWDCELDLDALWRHYDRVVKPNGAVVLTGVQPFTSKLVMSNPKGFRHEWIWHKSKSGSAFTAKYRPMAKHESVLIFCRGKLNYRPRMVPGEPYRRTRKPPPINNHKLGFGRSGESTTINEGTRYPESVQFFQQKWRRQDQLHPTQKPVEMVRYFIETYTDEGEVVLDNCVGCGTTAIAALEAGRSFIAMEQDEKYFEIAQTRIKEYCEPPK